MVSLAGTYSVQYRRSRRCYRRLNQVGLRLECCFQVPMSSLRSSSTMNPPFFFSLSELNELTEIFQKGINCRNQGFIHNSRDRWKSSRIWRINWCRCSVIDPIAENWKLCQRFLCSENTCCFLYRHWHMWVRTSVRYSRWFEFGLIRTNLGFCTGLPNKGLVYYSVYSRPSDIKGRARYLYVYK